MHPPFPTVSIQAVPDYQPDRVLEAMRTCLEPFGGMKAFVQPGQRVLLKPNLVTSFAPERAATTHPSVVRAAILLAQEAGGLVKVGDSPGMGTLTRVAQVAGLMPVLKETGAELVDFSTPHEFHAPENVVAPKLTLTKALLDADVLITLPKLKTHAQMSYTGALKNQYGLVPGALKSQWHFRLQQPDWLATLVLEINHVARPSLAIMDAITAMEGPGPTGGRPRFVGALLAGRDLAAVDTMACQIIGLNPMRVPILAAARKKGCGETDPKLIPTVGCDWQKLVVLDFDNVVQIVDTIQLVPLPPAILHWIRKQWTAKPKIINGPCTRCGICSKVCPVEGSAIHPSLEAARQVDNDRCIACYCCHEMCPSKAIELVQPWLARKLPLTKLADRLSRVLGALGGRKH